MNKNVMNKNLILVLVVALFAGFMVSCEHYETYADQKDAENATISNYISTNKIHTISEDEFNKRIANNDSVLTDTSKNEYVLFSNTGIYMQIIERGTGKILQSGENATVLCRFSEYNLKVDSVQLSNMDSAYYYNSYLVDKMNVTKKSGSFYGSFVSGSSLMYSTYGNASVPSGWLVPLSYIGLGRYTDEKSRIAHVKLIVPHDQGQAYATSNVYACAYEIYYERGV